MNQAMWVCIREYVAAEAKLAVARALKGTQLALVGNPIPALEEQSTRMETEVRRLLEEHEKLRAETADLAREAASHHVRY